MVTQLLCPLSPGSPANGDMYYNNVSNRVRVYQNGGWQDLATGSGGVGTGVAGRLALYPSNGTSVDDIMAANGFDMSINIDSQSSRSSNISYVIPNPGDSVSVANFVLDRGDQTIMGVKTVSGTLAMSALTASLPLQLDGSKNVISAAINLASAQISGILSVSNGGTGSSASLSNNRIMVSSGGAIVEATAVTAARALISDANGIPTSSVTTATELSYVNGATSNLQSQINTKLSSALAENHIFVGNASGLAADVAMSGEASILASGAVALSNAAVIGKVLTGYTSGAGTVAATDSLLQAIQKLNGNDDLRVLKAGDTMTGELMFADGQGIDAEASASVLNIGQTNADTINIGNSGATVNIIGTLQYVNVTDLTVTDKLVTINKGGTAGSGNLSGIEIEEDSVITAYVKTNNTRDSWDHKAPANAGIFRLTGSTAAFTGNLAQAVLTADRTWTLPDVSGTIALISGGVGSAANTALSNLASTAVNANIIAGSDNAIDLGSAAINWKDVHAKQVLSSTVLALRANGTSLDFLAAKTRRTDAAAGTQFMEEQYFDALALSSNVVSPTVITALNISQTAFEGLVIEYKIKEATSNKVRIGKLIVTHDGTTASSSDQFSETAALGSALGLSLDATLNGGNIQIRYNNTNASNACTMHCLVKRFRA